ncbi:odorant receptor 43a-like isoform X2 [Solenopsis invicta]|uniref:odorant receptor 43a-like isoform X2 n=1 Tax=Solenopsis invicta TaxID=13686 RepID=UPI00193CACB9|nr:odorant receptor 43a-like isoform X2 [Solenopsis invicta]
MYMTNFLLADYADLEWAIGLHRCILEIVGLWPQQNKDQYKEFFSKFRKLFNATAIIYILIIPGLAQLINVWGDMIQIIDNLQFTLTFLVTILKVYIMWYKKGALLLLINKIIKDWTRVKMDEERNVMVKKAKITRLILQIGLFITISATFSRPGSIIFKEYIWHVNNLTNHERSLPVPAHYWYDVTSSPKYELTYLAQTIGLVTCAITYVGVDNFLGLLILHVCGQMENLHLRLLHLGNDSDFKAVLKYNVKDHICLIRSVKIIDDTFNLLLLAMIGFFCVLFSLFGFLVLTAVNQDTQLSFAQMSWYFLASGTLLMHTCLYCAVGEHLVNKCEEVHSATYECVWYTLEPKATRNLAVIMVCAKKPLNITAGKMFPMTMSTFCSVSFVMHVKYDIILYQNYDIKTLF